MTIVLRLTLAEAQELHCVAMQGWGDGDHADWLGDGRKVQTCKRAVEKLEKLLKDAGGLK